jgi:hypothetical protein
MPTTVILRASCHPHLRTVIEAPAELIVEINTRMPDEFQFVTDMMNNPRPTSSADRQVSNGKASFLNSYRTSTAATIDAIKACKCKLTHFNPIFIEGRGASEVCVFDYYGNREAW